MQLLQLSWLGGCLQFQFLVTSRDATQSPVLMILHKATRRKRNSVPHFVAPAILPHGEIILNPSSSTSQYDTSMRMEECLTKLGLLGHTHETT
jgi:hypothetical protein